MSSEAWQDQVPSGRRHCEISTIRFHVDEAAASFQQAIGQGRGLVSHRDDRYVFEGGERDHFGNSGTLEDGPRYGHPETVICRRRERSAVAHGFPNCGTSPV